MINKSLLSLSVAGVVSLLTLGTADFAEANHWRPKSARQEIRQDWSEIREGRAELRRDYRELQRDRADLRRLYRNGASRSEINNKRNEIRGDLREIGEGRRELRRDYAELRRDRARLGYGNGGRFDNHTSWNRYDNGRWGDHDRRNARDRWSWR